MQSGYLKQTICDAATAQRALSDLFSWADTVDMAYAWATSCEGGADHWGCVDLDKLRRVVIGTQFAQTEPWVLRCLHAHASSRQECEFRVVVRGKGTFHPKLAMGRRGDQVRVLMGSSNLTVGGFGANTELNVLAQFDEGSKEVASFDDFMDRCMEQGEPLDLGWLAAYENHCKRKPKSSGWTFAPNWRFNSIDDVDMHWDDFVEVVRGQQGRLLKRNDRLSLDDPTRSYLAEVDRMSPVVASNARFEDWGEDDRVAAIGLKPSSGYFGRMTRASMAIHSIRTEPEVFGRFLDAIPKSGPVPRDVFERAIHGLDEIKYVGIGVASRLMVAIRPDVFMPVNYANQIEIQRFSGKRVTTANRYVEWMDRVWSTPWFRSARPIDPEEARLWDCRAAILDAVVYDR